MLENRVPAWSHAVNQKGDAMKLPWIIAVVIVSVGGWGCGGDDVVDADTYRVSEYFTITPGNSQRILVYCDEGDLVTGGGYYLNASSIPDADRMVEVFSNQPLSRYENMGEGWDIGITNIHPDAERFGFAYAVCIGNGEDRLEQQPTPSSQT